MGGGGRRPGRLGAELGRGSGWARTGSPPLPPASQGVGVRSPLGGTAAPRAPPQGPACTSGSAEPVPTLCFQALGPHSIHHRLSSRPGPGPRSRPRPWTSLLGRWPHSSLTHCSPLLGAAHLGCGTEGPAPPRGLLPDRSTFSGLPSSQPCARATLPTRPPRPCGSLSRLFR